MIVLDGNMKNSRQICEATDAGFVEHDGLPGMVKTGCMNTPDQKSRFCAIDKPRQLVSDDCSGVIEMIVKRPRDQQLSIRPVDISDYSYLHNVCDFKAIFAF